MKNDDDKMDELKTNEWEIWTIVGSMKHIDEWKMWVNEMKTIEDIWMKTIGMTD
jgi:hypothetical protein